MIASIKENDELQMNAYCDAELDPASAIEFERRLADDESLKARYNRLLSLRRAVRSLLQYELPPGLQARIQSALNADGPGQTNLPGPVVRLGQAGRPRQRSWSFQALAAAAVFGAVISSSVMLAIEPYNLHEDVARVVVVGHDPVATIVYKHAKHTVSLTTLPPGQSVSDQAIAGYNVRSWSDPEFTYIAVSDLPSADLASFERAFFAGSPAPETK